MSKAKLVTAKKIASTVAGLSVCITVGILIKANAPTTRLVSRAAVSIASIVLSGMLSSHVKQFVNDEFDSLIEEFATPKTKTN
jgi:hypothetical protein